MRKILAALVIAAAQATAWGAASGALTVVNQAGLTYSTAPVVNLQAYLTPQTAAGKLSAQVTFSSVPYVAQTFKDGTQSTGSVTFASTNILATPATNQVTVPSTALILGKGATEQITISSCVPNSTIFFNTRPLREGVDWSCGASTTLSAKNLAAAFKVAYGNIFTSTNTANVVFSTANTVGPSGNSFTMTSSSQPAYSTTTWRGGTDRALLDAIVTFNGVQYLNGQKWTDQSNTSTGTALSIAGMMANFGVVTATVPTNGTVVFSTATTAGAAGNLFTLTSSNAGLTVAKPTYTGGQDASTFVLNGVTFTAGVNYSTGTTTQDATNLAAAINTSASSKTVTAQGIGTLMTTTSTVTGILTNYTMATNQPANLTLSNPTMTGGTTAADTLGSANIVVPAHGYTTALGVVYSTGSAQAIGGLIWGTTYFVIVVDSNTIQLSTSSAQAVLSVGTVVTSTSTQTTAHTFTLTPQAFVQGPAAAKWQVSNDGINFADYLATSGNVSVSSNTFTPVFPSSTTIQDFGLIDYGFIRYNFTPPTSGGIQIKVILNAKE